MNISFDVKLAPQDLYRFNIYQTYTTTQGPISIILALLAFLMAGITFHKAQIGFGVLYVVVGIVFIVYIPVTLWIRSNRTIKNNKVLSGALHYDISKKGFEVSQNEDSGLLEWNQIYKMVTVGGLILIYSNRVNAYIIPKEQVGENYEALKALAEEELESYRFKMK